MDKQMQESRRRLAAAWAGAAMVLAACGGGGGGGTATPTGAAISAAPSSASSEAPVGLGFSESNGVSSPGPQTVAAGGGGSASAGAPASPPPSASFAQRIVNTDPAGDQSNASIATLAAGGYLVAWTVAPPAGGSTGSVCWLRLDAETNAAGAQRCTSVSGLWTGNGSATTSVAAAGNGALVSWQVFGDAAGHLDVQAQRVDASGAPVGGPFLANAPSAEDQGYSASAGLAGGGAIVVWRDNPTQSIRMQRYDASGAAVGGETRVDAGANGDRFTPAVAGLADGGFVVAWSGQQPGTSGSAVYTRRFDAGGAPLGGETLVSDAQAVGLYPKLAALSGGGYVVAFNNGSAAVAQRFAANGSMAGARIALDADWLQTAPNTCYRPYATECPPYQVVSGVGALADGGFVAVWGNSTGISLSHGLFGRRFAADGNAGPVQQLLNPSAMGTGHAIRATADGGFVMTWNGADSDLGGVMLQRFAADALR